MIRKKIDLLSSNELPIIWLIIHAFFGILVAFLPILAKVWSVIPVVFGVYYVVKTKNSHNEAALFAAYYVGLEILLRMTGATITWEFAKYFLIFIFIIGLTVERKYYQWEGWWIIVMIVLLIPGVLVTFSWSERVKIDILFNESGIMALSISCWYFYKRPLTFSTLKRILSWMLLPLLSICFYVFIKTPDYSNIVFSSNANFDMTGGYGPNQIATALGTGWMIVLLYYFYGMKITPYKILDIALFAFLLFRALFSFSRGGNYTAILSLIMFVIVNALYGNKRVISPRTLTNITIFIIVSVLSVNVIDNITGGIFSNRFTGKTTTGEQMEDITTGRLSVLKQEINLFIDHPLGVGAGGSAAFRGEIYHDPNATHNEFGRLLSEHGIYGIIVIALLLWMPIGQFFKLNFVDNKAFLVLFFVLSVATMMHSAMRIALPAFFYGLSYIYLYPPQDDSVHR